MATAHFSDDQLGQAGVDTFNAMNRDVQWQTQNDQQAQRQSLADQLALAREQRLQQVNEHAAQEAIRKENALAKFHAALASVDPTKTDMRIFGPKLISEIPEAMSDPRAVAQMDYNMKLYDDHQKALTELAANKAKEEELKAQGMYPDSTKVGDTTFRSVKEITPIEQARLDQQKALADQKQELADQAAARQKELHDQMSAQKDQFEKQAEIRDAQHALERGRDKYALTQATSERKGSEPFYNALETQNKNIAAAADRLLKADPTNEDALAEKEAVQERRNEILLGKHSILQDTLTKLPLVGDAQNYKPEDPDAFAKTVRELNAIKKQLGYDLLDEKTGKVIPSTQPSTAPAVVPGATPAPQPAPSPSATPAPSVAPVAVRKYNPVTGRIE